MLAFGGSDGCNFKLKPGKQNTFHYICTSHVQQVLIFLLRKLLKFGQKKRSLTSCSPTNSRKSTQNSNSSFVFQKKINGKSTNPQQIKSQGGWCFPWHQHLLLQGFTLRNHSSPQPLDFSESDFVGLPRPLLKYKKSEDRLRKALELNPWVSVSTKSLFVGT